MDLNHILFIPDGNRRWAKKRDLKPWEGHKAGGESFKKIVEYIVKHNTVKYLSFWAMSKDNYIKRPKNEISHLIKIINDLNIQFAKNEDIEDYGVNIRFYGSWEKIFDKKIVTGLKKVEYDTRNNKKFFLSILLAYDGKEELINALNSMEKGKRINEKTIKRNLWTKDLPDVDLIVRTGVNNDPHLSGNVLLWQTSYSQLYFSETFWPAFDINELKKAINDYSSRKRRRGK